MTFHRGEGFSCDTCSDSIETELEFQEAIGFIRSKGWRTYKGPDKQYAHACPSCVADFARQSKPQG